MTRTILSTAAIALFAGTSAQAAFEANAVTDLNLRAGPGPMYNVETVIAGQDEVSIEGCLADANWCKVSYNGTTGWAYGYYLSTSVDDQQVALTAEPARSEITTIVVDDQTEENMIMGGAFGATVGAIIGGPFAIAASAAAGAITAELTEPSADVIAYVNGNPVDTVLLDGEVVVGAGIPEGVEFHEVPNSEFSYLTVNGQVVIVEPGDRKIISILR